MNLIEESIVLLKGDPMRMECLHMHHRLNLPDSWIGAGFLRNMIWDHIHNKTTIDYPSDIDVIYFDPDHRIDAKAIEQQLNDPDSHRLTSLGVWSLKNQAVMHQRNNDPAYRDSIDALRYWPETCTAVATRLNMHNEIEIAAPFGLEDIYNLMVRPTEMFQGKLNNIFQDRVKKKNWLHFWPRLKVAAL